MAAWDVMLIVVLVALCVTGLVMTALRLPGTWLILAVAVAYAWHGDWSEIGGGTLVALGGMALLAEAVEFFASVMTARRVGASRQAGWGGLIGGIVGMIFLSIPVPVIGTMVGAVAGCFLGAAVAELAVRKHVGQGARVGLLAALGMILGTATKMAIALAMCGLLVISLW